ncbi:MAG: Gfo/Idh/MocA family oxidoreductase [Leptolinea sp.]|nr:Gfo/Idh/MocA family oxidoreductase [Leptolinea sp.]
MLQLTQKLKDGKIQALEVPAPSIAKGCVLVRNHYSLISAGTEGSTVKTARSSYLAKAKERPQQVKQVIDVAMSQGVEQAYRAVMKKLDAHSPMGYSSVGEVVAVGMGVTEFSIGDLVACGGLTACHAEIVSVPVNLCVTLHADADLRQAAYNTLGAIALQGVRQADLRLGETCAVIGLGLLGQITALLLKSSGVRVVGTDIDQAMVDIAKDHCADLAITRHSAGIENKIMEYTGGIGCDAVIITAAANSLDPINFAGSIARKKGTVVVVGAVPTGFDREPHFYRKELQVKMSCSYGPGRYDPLYEEKGIDYPAAYVRWTEKRNMQAFQELIHSRKMDVSYLTTHTFKLAEARSAYDMLLAKSEPYIGILIEYDTEKKLTIDSPRSVPIDAKLRKSTVSVGFIGAGSYAQSNLLPNIPRSKEINLVGVMTATGTSSRTVADRYGFDFCTANEKDILESPVINTIFIATRHDSHGDYVLKALNMGKHVFVEKPLCLSRTDLDNIKAVYESSRHQENPIGLMVGYNRRFSPLAKRVKEEFGDGPMAMTYRINSGSIPADSWIQDMEIGGGRVIGEICHFVDFLTFLNGSLPISVYADVMAASNKLNDTLVISLKFQNGSIGSISYLANGDKGLAKERIEIFAHGCTVVIDDFKNMVIYAGGRKKEKHLLSQDKGQKSEVGLFIETILNGQAPLIPFKEIYSTSLVTYEILESIRNNEVRLLK